MKNLRCTKEHSRKSMALIEKTARMGGENLLYRLLVTSDEPCRFSIGIFEESGVGIVKSVGADLSVAEWILELMVDNTVAPCHLSEIVDELLEQAGD